jgi:hypothetical protein
MGSTPSLQATFDRWSGAPWPSKRKQAIRLPSASPRLSIGFRSRTGVADQPAGEPMLNGYEAFAVGGAFLVAAILVWKKLRFIERRLGELQNEINELRTVESRLFMMALNAKSKEEAADSPTVAGEKNVAD